MVRRMVLVVAMVVLAASCYKSFDFDNDGKADAVAVTSTGAWRDLAQPAADPPLYAGTPTGLAVPGDYDGSGRFGVAVVTSAGDWVTQGSLGTVHFPAPPQLPGYTNPYALNWFYKMVPVPADYDGDKKADPAWYRNTDGTWFIAGQAPIQFGTGPTVAYPAPVGGNANDAIDQDVPVPADYDGDGQADLATFNPRTRVWKVRSSKDGTISSVTMPGTNTDTDLPVPGDYDGVHHAQRALLGFGGWRIEGHATPVLFGNYDPTRTDREAYPAPADYDGDGKFDLSYVGADGIWRIRSSADPSIMTTFTVGRYGAAGASVPVQFTAANQVAFPQITLVGKNCLPSTMNYPHDC